jgi:hypothetical protein
MPRDRSAAIPDTNPHLFPFRFVMLLQARPAFALALGATDMIQKLLRVSKEATRSPVTTILEIAGYIKYHALMARFPVLVDEYSLRPISLTVPSEFRCCNPSIIATQDGWLATIRTYNLYSVKDGTIHKIDGEKLINENWLVSYTDDFRVRTQTIIDIDHSVIDSETRNTYLPNGIADYRIFRRLGEYYLLGYGTNIRDHLDTMILGCLQGDRVTRIHLIKSPKNADVEKNWMPVESDGELSVIYSVNPFELMSIEDGKPSSRYIKPRNRSIAEYRGSSQAIRYNAGFLCVVHRNMIVRWRRIYLHRLVFFDKNWDITRTSKEFFIEKKGAEFCAGLANKGDRYVISYGLRNIHARMVEMSASLVERLLDGA